MVEAFEAAGINVVMLSDLLGYDPYQVKDDDLAQLRHLLRSVRGYNAEPERDAESRAVGSGGVQDVQCVDHAHAGRSTAGSVRQLHAKDRAGCDDR